MAARDTFANRLIERVASRPPDFIIGAANNPYLLRWYILPRNKIFNVYLHQFLRSDDDRALHDHPWVNLSILLRGGYFEHTIEAGGIERKEFFWAGEWRFRHSGRIAHRVELLLDGDEGPKPCWTLFITGPRYRSWGFHCPKQGWIRWDLFTTGDRGAEVGKGCEA
jgi:hypothetical protein